MNLKNQNIDWTSTDFLDVLEEGHDVAWLQNDDDDCFCLGETGCHWSDQWAVTGKHRRDYYWVEDIHDVPLNPEESRTCSMVVTRFFAQYRMICRLESHGKPHRGGDIVKALADVIVSEDPEKERPSHWAQRHTLRDWLLRLIDILDRKSNKELFLLSQKDKMGFSWERIEMQARQAYLAVCLDIYRFEQEAAA